MQTQQKPCLHFRPYTNWQPPSFSIRVWQFGQFLVLTVIHLTFNDSSLSFSLHLHRTAQVMGACGSSLHSTQKRSTAFGTVRSDCWRFRQDSLANDLIASRSRTPMTERCGEVTQLKLFELLKQLRCSFLDFFVRQALPTGCIRARGCHAVGSL